MKEITGKKHPMHPQSLATQEPTGPEVAATALAEEDLLRAGTYALLGGLLAGPPTAELLGRLEGIEAGTDDGGEMAASWALLRQAGERADVAGVDDEYHDLFVGLGRGEVVPYASWYLTGFLMERPLALLRHDLARYGIETREGVSEPEDHAGALCEAMAVLIQEGNDEDQRALFRDHLAPWMERFFHDLQQARAARFYWAVGRLGEQFMRFERQYLDLPATADEA